MVASIERTAPTIESLPARAAPSRAEKLSSIDDATSSSASETSAHRRPCEVFCDSVCQQESNGG